MATMFQVFDVREALSGDTHHQRFIDGGLEAPRNSLDVPDGAADIERRNSSNPGDIPFGYECHNRARVASGAKWQSSSASCTLGHLKSEQSAGETKRRAPNIVARLMGLDAMPDELLSVRPRKSLQEMPTYGYAKLAEGSPVLFRQHSHGAVPSSWQRPPLPRNAQRTPASEGIEEKVLAPTLTFRDHPQEEQLQRFKIEFEAKQKERARNTQLEDVNHQLEEKKNKVRATLDKARIALSQGIMAESKQRLNGQGKFEESKEFLDAMEFLQCNKDFIFHFLQQKPHVVFSNEVSNATTPVIHPKMPKKGKSSSPSTPKEPTERKREGFSPRAITRLFMPSDSKKRNENKRHEPCTISSGNGPQPAFENCSRARRESTGSRDSSENAIMRSSSSTTSRHMSPAVSPKVPKDEAKRSNKNVARDVIGEIKERLRQRSRQDIAAGEDVGVAKSISKEHLRSSGRDSADIAREIAKKAREGLGSWKSTNNISLTKTLSTGKRISFQTPVMEDMACTSDGEGMTTPSVKVVRENVMRSCISLPSSPHLFAPQADEIATRTKAMHKRISEKSLIPELTGPIENLVRFSAADKVIAKKTTLASESPRCGSLRSSTEVAKSPLRRSASVSESSTPRNSSKPACNSVSMRHLNGASEPASSLTRCRSVPNVALLRERGQCATKPAHMLSKPKPGIESTPVKVRQSDENKKGLFSIGRKKGRDSSEAIHSASGPVLARVAALAESCVSQSNTLSDADNAPTSKVHTRSYRNGLKKGKENPREMIHLSKPLIHTEFLKRFRESSSPDESVIPESDAESDPGSCENDFLEVLSQLTSSPRPKSPAASPGTTPRRLQSTVCPPSPRTRKVQNAKKRPERTGARTTVRDIPHNLDEAGQDSSSDKNGQPSPVSVLDPTFESEDSPSPHEIKEITNNFKELHLRLRLLKADKIDSLVRDDFENVAGISSTCAPRHTRRGATQDSVRDSSRLSTNLRQDSQGCGFKAAPCPAGSELDFAFVRDVLVTSGFHTHGGRSISRWHSSTQPISLHLFNCLEASYSHDKRGGSRRQILFDAVNEIIVARLEPQCYQQLGLKVTESRNVSISSFLMTNARKVVEDIWLEIQKRQFPARCHDSHNDYLESLVAQDLKSSSSWLALYHDVDRVCLKLEKAIFDDLIEELCEGMIV